MIPTPDGMDLDTAGPFFCGGITVFNPLVQFDVKPTDRVAVVGIGDLGHLAVRFLRAWGCEVTAFTSNEAKRTLALDLGAHHTLDSRDAQTIASVAGRFDLILVTVNVALDWNLYLSTLAPRGRLHFVGAVLEPLAIGAFSVIVGQRSVSGSPVASPQTMRAILDFALQHDIRPAVEEFLFEDVNAAIERLPSGRARYRVVRCR